jgi:hypothetical protein
MLDEFDLACKEFEEDAYDKLDVHEFDAAKDKRSHGIQVQAQSLARDIGHSCMILRDLYITALQVVSDQYDADIKDPPVRAGLVNRSVLYNSLEKLAVGFKSLFFFIRAYQDMLYMTILCLNEQPVGSRSGMKDALNKDMKSIKQTNPAGELLLKIYPEYADWFRTLRARRNDCKFGTAVSYSTSKNLTTGETNLAIRLGRSKMIQSPDLSLHDITKALKISTILTKSIVEHGININKLS